MQRSFSRVAIVNRGEAALRFIHAALELNREGERLHTIALYTEPDRHAAFVREADEAFELGPATVEGPDGRRKVAYLDLARLERALRQTRAEAAWPGWGFVAEQPAFAELCERLGVTFIGPSAAAMSALGDKITAKRLAEGLGHPGRAVGRRGRGERGRGRAAGAGARAARRDQGQLRHGWPRACARRRRASCVAEAFRAARAEAWKTLGQTTVFLERRLDGVRQIDVQVIADAWGGIWALPAREASIQRRHQKLVEESPAPGLPPAREAVLRQAAMRLVRAAGYVGAVAIEFLCDPLGEDYWFLEANTRLEVEHAVSEATTGIDLVKLQVHVARGGRLPGDAPSCFGHAVEVRLCAEDAEANFAPAPGTVARLRLPGGPGLRVDVGVSEGDLVPAEFDSMIAKLIAFGRDREEALGRLARGLTQTDVVLRGGTTNKAFLLDLLDRDEMRSGRLDVRFLDRLVARGEQTSRRHAEVALVRAAIEAYETEADAEKARFRSTALRGRPEVRPEASRSVEMRQGGQAYQVTVRRTAVDRYRVEESGHRVDVAIERLGAPLRERRLQTSEWRLGCGGSSFRVLSLVQERTHLVEVDGVPHTFTREALGLVTAPAPAIVVSVAVKAGRRGAGGPAAAGARGDEDGDLARGAVRRARARGDRGPERAGGSRRPAAGARSRRRAPGRAAARAAAAPRRARRRRRGASGGLAPGARGAARPDARLRRRGGRPARGPGALARRAGGRGVRARRRERCSTSSPTSARCSGGRARAGWSGTRRARSSGPRSTSSPTCASWTSAGRGCRSRSWRSCAGRCGTTASSTWRRLRALEESLYRICKAHQREEQLAALVSLPLNRFLECEASQLAVIPELPALLDRLIAATRSRYPAVNDLASEVRYRLVERPLLERVRGRGVRAGRAGPAGARRRAAGGGARVARREPGAVPAAARGDAGRALADGLGRGTRRDPRGAAAALLPDPRPRGAAADGDGRPAVRDRELRARGRRTARGADDARGGRRTRR